jgi:hypothetical protein
MEDLLQQFHPFPVAEHVEPQPSPGLRGALHDAGADSLDRRVGVEPDPAGRGLLEAEHEVGEHLVGAEPDVGIAAGFDLGAEVLAVELADPAAGAVGGHDEIGLGQLGGILDRAAVANLHPEL